MIKDFFYCLHWRYVMARHEDGTATPLYSTSRPILRALRREGPGGLSEGIAKTREALGFVGPPFSEPEKEIILWPGLFIGAIEFMLIIVGFRNRPNGNWQWFRNLLE